MSLQRRIILERQHDDVTAKVQFAARQARRARDIRFTSRGPTASYSKRVEPPSMPVESFCERCPAPVSRCGPAEFGNREDA